MNRTRKTAPNIPLRPIAVLPVSFACIILCGTLLLTLPAATATGMPLPLADALFTATSASYVTGLIVVDTGTAFSPFGQAVLLTLIQLGGLGFMTMATILFAATRHRVSLYERLSMAEGLGEDRVQGVVGLCRAAVRVTFGCEALGALLLSVRFIPQFGVGRGIWMSVFHSVSAFCNAGFDLFGGYTSLTGSVEDIYLQAVVMALIIVGGLGFAVILDVASKRRFARFRLHTKVVLAGTAALILGGALLFTLMEYRNPLTLGPLPFGQKLAAGLFQSVTMRTAGFNTIDQLALTDASKGVGMLLMLIGGAPAGTAGGLKLTTIFALVWTVYAYVLGGRETVAFHRTIPSEQIRRALTILVGGMLLLFSATILLSFIEQGSACGQLGIWNQLYETTSAMCTVGVSTGVTAAAGPASRLILMLLMFIGRVGLLSMAMALVKPQDRVAVRYPDEELLIG